MRKQFYFVPMLLMASAMNGQGHLPGWVEGELEYHMICTGRGESIFVIMPDSTSMLIDAGDWYSLTDQMAPAMPDERFRPGEYIKRYIQKVNPRGNFVDYLMVSHFHNDHTGDTTIKGLPKTKGKNPDYVITGITEVGQEIRFGKEFDRGYPDYNYPKEINDPDVDNLRAFFANESQEHGLVQEKFNVGELNQIKLSYMPENYADFSIRNIAASGEVWTGTEGETVKCYDLNEKNIAKGQNENTKSIAIRMNYGPFSLYTGGDLSGKLTGEDGERFNVEELVGKATGQVNVAKLNHHGYRDSTPMEFVKSVDAHTYLVPVWDYWHIQPTVMSNIETGSEYKGGDPIVFPNHVFYNHKKEFGGESWFKMISPEVGHVVVKVAPHGESYKIYVVDATDESMNVIAEYGPYKP